MSGYAVPTALWLNLGLVFGSGCDTEPWYSALDVAAAMGAQPGADADFRMPRAENLSVGAFAVHLDPPLPVRVVEVTEHRPIHLGRTTYSVTAQNISDETLAAYTVAAVVVASDGTIKAVQRLPTVKNLGPGRARKQDHEIRVGVPSISDRIAYVTVAIEGQNGKRWSIDDDRLQKVLKEVAPRP